MHITYDLPVSIDDILEAKQRLAGKIYKTGMPRSNYFSERCQGEIFLKFENMQRTGSFKIRGAFNKLCGLTAAEKRKGVVACSAGNHAQGVSLSCAMLGIDGKVVMPKGAPKSKVAATCDYSAEVVLHGDNFNDTLAKASDIVELEGRIFIPQRLAAGKAQLNAAHRPRLAKDLDPLFGGQLLILPGEVQRIGTVGTLQRAAVGQLRQQPQWRIDGGFTLAHGR